MCAVSKAAGRKRAAKPSDPALKTAATEWPDLVKTAPTAPLWPPRRSHGGNTGWGAMGDGGDEPRKATLVPGIGSCSTPFLVRTPDLNQGCASQPPEPPEAPHTDSLSPRVRRCCATPAMTQLEPPGQSQQACAETAGRAQSQAGAVGVVGVVGVVVHSFEGFDVGSHGTLGPGHPGLQWA